MDKQKQIEEMAKILEFCCNGENIENCNSDRSCNSCRAKYLYDAGYRKIPENAVMLTKEEYKKLFIDDFGIMTSSIGDLRINPEGMRKAVDEIDRLLRVQMELQVINAKYYNENKDLRRNMTKLRRETYSKEEVDYKIENTRKETAEKFAERVSKAFIGLNCIDIDEWNWCQNKIDEICKEITEGKA